jgi:hypothetical protein
MSAINISFAVGGIKNVQEAFRSVIAAQREMERQVNRSAAAELRTRTASARSVEQTQERKYKHLVATLAKEEKASARTELRKASAAEKASRDAIRADEQRFNAIVRRLDREQREVERVEQNKLRAREVAERRALDIQLNSAKMSGKIAADQVREQVALRNRFTGGIAGTVMRSAGGALGGIARVGGSILALGGGFSAADAVQRTVAARGKAADLENQSGGAVKKDQILAKAAEVGTSMGTSTEAVIDGMDAFVAKSGDMKAAFSGIRDLVELATATGADLGELSRTAGIVHMGTGNMAQTMAQMRTLAGGGRAGSVDMRELSQYAGRISSGANQFGDKGAAFNQLSTIVQQAAATGGATAAPEATEAVTRLATDIYENEETFKGLGIKTRDKTGKFLDDPMSIIKSSISKTGGDSGKLLGMFGKMSYRAVAGYQDVYNRAAQGVRDKGGNAKDADIAGIAAIDEAFKKIAEQSLKEGQVKAEANRRLLESDKQLEMVLNQLRETVGNELVPEITKLIPTIRDMIPVFAKLLKGAVEFAEWFANNPLAGIGLVVAAAVTKDIALAGIGALIKAEIANILAGGAAGGAGGGGLTGAAKGAIGGASAAGPLAAVGVGAIVTEKTQIDSILSGQTGGQRAVGELLADAKDPKKAAAVRARLDKARKGTGFAGAAKAYFSLGEAGVGEAISTVTGKENPYAKNIAEFETNRQIVDSADKIAAALATAAATAIEKKMKPATSTPPDPRNDPARTVSNAHPVRASK